MFDLHPEVDPLTTEESRWVKKLEKLLLACPSDRIALVTTGDNHLHVIDNGVTLRHDFELHDGSAHRNGVVIAGARSKPQIHAVSG